MITITIDKVVEKATINIETPFYYKDEEDFWEENNQYVEYGMVNLNEVVQIIKSVNSNEISYQMKIISVDNHIRWKEYLINDMYKSSKEEFEEVKKEMEEFLKTI